MVEVSEERVWVGSFDETIRGWEVGFGCSIIVLVTTNLKDFCWGDAEISEIRDWRVVFCGNVSTEKERESTIEPGGLLR